MTLKRIARFTFAALGLLALFGMAYADVPQFQDGDQLAIIGDSLTHGRRYHLFLNAFYATRFPERRINFINCGISGDTASGALRRFDWDIAPHKPNVATIQLGMNDVGVSLYGGDKTEQSHGAERTQRVEAFGKNMATLVDRLLAEKCRIVLITPTVYEDVIESKARNYKGANVGLERCTEKVRALAKEKNIPLVEVFAPMMALNEKLHAQSPPGTVVGPDRVHPLDPGMFFIAYRVLEEQGVAGVVSSVAIDAASGEATESTNATVGDLKASATGVSFTLLEKALPYPISSVMKPALEWTPFQEKMNREMLRVSELKAGEYDVLIDGTPVVRATAAELARGIDLATNDRTPMYQQAQKVYATLSSRFSQQVRIRGVAKTRHNILQGMDDTLDVEAAKPLLDAFLEKRKGASQERYYQGIVKSYLAYAPRLDEIQAAIDELTDKVYQQNQPKPHRFEIRAASGDAPQAGASDPSVLTMFDTMSDWKPVGITNVEAKVSTDKGIATVEMPQRKGERDLWSVWMPVTADTSSFKTIHFRVRAPKGKKTTLRVHNGKKLHNTISYVSGTGDWQDLTGNLPEGKATRVYIILGEPGASEPHDMDVATYEFDKIWFE